MESVFVEQLIVREKTAKQTAYAMLLMALTAILVAFSFVFLVPALAILLLFVLGFVMWRLLSEMNIEYEYSIFEGVIDIDRIVARRKRERVVSVSLQKAEFAGRYKPEEWRERGIDRVVMAAPSEKSEGLYCFSYRSKKRGHTLVVFQPNERTMEAFEKGLPRLLQRDLHK